ncbi:unnamed protein product [Lampetra planeri]
MSANEMTTRSAVVPKALVPRSTPLATGSQLRLRSFPHLLFGVPPPQREEGSHPVEHLLETLRGARGRAYPHGEAAHQRQEQGARPRMEPPFYTAGSEPQGPGESRGPRGDTSWGQPRRGAPVNPGRGLAPRGAMWCHSDGAARPSQGAARLPPPHCPPSPPPHKHAPAPTTLPRPMWTPTRAICPVDGDDDDGAWVGWVGG